LVVPGQEFGRLGEASLLSLSEPPSPFLLFSGILRHTSRPRSSFAQRLFFTQFFRLSGWQVYDDLVFGGDFPDAAYRQA
jgi:hypothetical protein